ncbi:MAG: hypothetical protein ACOCYB_09790 [Alkalispirochaeta sp.]
MTAWGWWRAGGLALGVLFLAACSDNLDLFSALDEQSEPELSTVKAGSVMEEGASLEVHIEYPSDESSRATAMRVELRDVEGTVHGTREFTADELAEPRLPRVEFSQPPDGVYNLVTEAWINDQPLFSDERQIFVAAVPPRIESVTIHPTSIRQEMQALALAEIDFSGSTRPYVRWLFDGGVAAEGYVEDGLDRTILDGSGRSAGAYRVSLEVYPWGVDEGTVIDGSTTITAESDVVVREELEPAPPEFAQREPGTVVRYFSFDGTRRAWTDGDREVVEASVEGDVFLDMVSGALGIQIPAGAAVSAPVPPPEDADTVYLVQLRFALPQGDGVPRQDPVISIGSGRSTGESVPIIIEDGTLAAHPPGADAIPLGPAPGERELSTVQFILRNQDGDVSLVSPLHAHDSGQSISPVGNSQELSVSVLGQDARQVFLDRITVTALTPEELRAQLIDRTTEQFLEAFGTDPRSWAVTAPETWTVTIPGGGDYPQPQQSISIGEDDQSQFHALLPEGGELELHAADESASAITLRRSGGLLILTDPGASEEERSQLEISPDDGERFSPYRLQLSRGPYGEGSRSAALISSDAEPEPGDAEDQLITVVLPEALRSQRITVRPDAADADYPVWVGR